jgi:CheY-like chemotaxis protein
VGTRAFHLRAADQPHCHIFDVALVDVGLPGFDGYELARRAREAGNAARLVALTGYGLPEDHRRSREAGFDAHLVKPVEPAQLSAVLAGC